MKKLICALLAALLACASCSALAEAGFPGANEAATALFEHAWVNEADPDDTLEIWFDGEAWRFSAVRLTETDAYSVCFDVCWFDEDQNALICKGGLLVRGLVMETGKEGEQAVLGDVEADRFDAVFTVDEDSLLHWTGSGDALEDRVFVNDDDLDDGLFTGEWECGDTSLSISLRRGVYSVVIFQNVGESDALCWEYTCTLLETGVLDGSGSRMLQTTGENGGPLMQYKYMHGEAAFTLSGDPLLWSDAVDDAGRDMAFHRIVSAQ